MASAKQYIGWNPKPPVVRVSVDYLGPDVSRWRDLWVLRFGEDGRCSAFEEWPFAPDQPDGH